jgi:hypothetical protein
MIRWASDLNLPHFYLLSLPSSGSSMSNSNAIISLFLGIVFSISCFCLRIGSESISSLNFFSNYKNLFCYSFNSLLTADLIIEFDRACRRFFSATKICLRSSLRCTNPNKSTVCLDLWFNYSNKSLRSIPYFASVFASRESVFIALPS